MIDRDGRADIDDQPAAALRTPHGNFRSSMQLSPGSPASESREKASAARDAKAGVPSLPELVEQFVGQDLRLVEERIRRAVSSRFEEVELLSRRAAEMGGKRLRPSLVLLSAQACQPLAHDRPRPHRDLLAIAAAVELVHAASLVHDDVMDAASQRRHQPTIVGQAGNSAAVLLGDFLFTRGYHVAASCSGTYPARRIAAAATGLCEGELRQQVSAGQWDMSKATYRSILLQKTGGLCAVSCRLGAWGAAADNQTSRTLHQFGNWLGLAFQICDDWLDYWGNQQVGKTLGTDLLQLKPTLPLIRLLETSPAKKRQQLIEFLNQQQPDSLAQIRQELDDCDASAYTLRIAKRCIQNAKSRLATLPKSPARECLMAVAEHSGNRLA